MLFGKFEKDESGSDCAEEGGEAGSEFVAWGEGEEGHGEPVGEDWFFEPGDAVVGGGDPVFEAEHVGGDSTVEAFIEIGQSIKPESEVREEAEDEYGEFDI